MSTNDQIILNQILEQRKAERAPTLTDADYFELFTGEQILKDFDLSYEEIEDGLVGGGNDGGIDSLYLFVNGDLVVEDTDLSTFKSGITVELVFIQSKTSPNFTVTPVERLHTSTVDLLDLSKDLGGLTETYNETLLEKMELFRLVHSTLAGRFPKLRFSYYYASKGDTPHTNVRKKSDHVKEAVSQLFSDAEVTFDFIGSAELLDMARRVPTSSFELTLSETPISTSEAGSFVSLVNLRQYYDFISGKGGKLNRNLFDANVRDYQGNVQVNQGIQESLSEKASEEDFWWLNNGVTIVATNATQAGKKLHIENPFVVNGLQTSTELYKYFSEKNPADEKRNLLVRVIVPSAQESRDRIIKATNSQTSIPPASLRATEQIHRGIEDYLKPHGIYYDRRKNYYKNEGKPKDKIISIGKMAQSVMSILLRRPNDARARPSSLIKSEEDYEKIFNTKHPLPLYKVCAVILQKIESVMKSDAANLEQAYRNNLRFHLAMYAALSICKDKEPSIESIKDIDINAVTDEMILECLDETKAIYEQLGATDQVAKSREFTNKLLEAVDQKYSGVTD